MPKQKKNILDFSNNLPISIELNFDNEIIYEETTDWSLIKQYFKLRADTYKAESENKLKGLLNQGMVDYQDYSSEFFIARDGNQCLGGSRLAVCKAGQYNPLPLEADIFRLKDLLPELELEKYNYGESGRTVVAKSKRNKEHTKRLFELTTESALNRHKCEYLFGVAPLSQARLYRILYKSVGVEAVIREDIALPQKNTDEGKRMYLVYADLRKSCASRMYNLENNAPKYPAKNQFNLPMANLTNEINQINNLQN